MNGIIIDLTKPVAFVTTEGIKDVEIICLNTRTVETTDGKCFSFDDGQICNIV